MSVWNRQDGLRVGDVRTDTRGHEWRVTGFMHDEGRWFIEDARGDYVHVMRAEPGKRGGKFVKCKTFLKSLVDRHDATAVVEGAGTASLSQPPPVPNGNHRG